MSVEIAHHIPTITGTVRQSSLQAELYDIDYDKSAFTIVYSDNSFFTSRITFKWSDVRKFRVSKFDSTRIEFTFEEDVRCELKPDYALCHIKIQGLLGRGEFLHDLKKWAILTPEMRHWRLFRVVYKKPQA